MFEQSRGASHSPPRADARNHAGAIPAGSAARQFGVMLGASEPMCTLFDQIERVAPSSAPVIILGESGSGKELVAATLHARSGRAAAPFIAINCGAIPENLIESELFGHERGSFTGASRTHCGFFERADTGTLFLDEVTEMPLDMQVRLLRVLETGRFCRVGGDCEIDTDVRVLAASNRDLQQAVAEGRLREDLMYRLCVVPLMVPPLRERGDDAVLLAEAFLERLNLEHQASKRWAAEAIGQIREYAWPGNVRELENVIHRAFVLSDDEIQLDLTGMALGCTASAPVAASTAGAADDANPFVVQVPVGMSLDDAERALITATLKAVDGSKSKAAHVLGISLKTLYNRLHAYDDADAAPTSDSERSALPA